MSAEIILRNRQKRKLLDLVFLRRVIRTIIGSDADSGVIREVAIYFVSSVEMARLNNQYLRHTGATDVITFDYNQPGEIRGDIFICVDVAVIQARQFKTSWQSEIVRYVVHGLLHLRGYDDKASQLRKAMKNVENNCVRQLGQQFDLRQLDKKFSAPKLPRNMS